MRTTAQEVLGLDLLENALRHVSGVGRAEDLAREVNVIHGHRPRRSAVAPKNNKNNKNNKKAGRRHLQRRVVGTEGETLLAVRVHIVARVRRRAALQTGPALAEGAEEELERAPDRAKHEDLLSGAATTTEPSRGTAGPAL